MLSVHEVLALIPSTPFTGCGESYLQSEHQEEKVKAILNYLVSLKLAWAREECCSRKQTTYRSSLLGLTNFIQAPESHMVGGEN